MSKTLLLKPVLTEKSLNNKEVYTYLVDRAATKHAIKEIIEKLYKVEVKTIKTMVKKGKIKTVGRKRIKKTLPSIKKVYITLKKGKIEDFPRNN